MIGVMDQDYNASRIFIGHENKPPEARYEHFTSHGCNHGCNNIAYIGRIFVAGQPGKVGVINIYLKKEPVEKRSIKDIFISLN